MIYLDPTYGIKSSSAPTGRFDPQAGREGRQGRGRHPRGRADQGGGRHVMKRGTARRDATPGSPCVACPVAWTAPRSGFPVGHRTRPRWKTRRASVDSPPVGASGRHSGIHGRRACARRTSAAPRCLDDAPPSSHRSYVCCLKHWSDAVSSDGASSAVGVENDSLKGSLPEAARSEPRVPEHRSSDVPRSVKVELHRSSEQPCEDVLEVAPQCSGQRGRSLCPVRGWRRTPAEARRERRAERRRCRVQRWSR